MFKTNIFYLSLILTVLIAGFISYRYLSLANRTDRQQNNEEADKNIDTNSTEEPLYHSDEYVSFDIPAGFMKETAGGQKIRLIKDVIYLGSGPTNYIYIKVIDITSDTNNKNMEFFENIKINRSDTMEQENEELNEWYRYKRLEDKEISGLQAKTFVNLNPYDFPKGTTELMYILKNQNETNIIIGAFLGTDTRSNYYIAQEVFENFVNRILVK
jgi:hypothetical protein